MCVRKNISRCVMQKPLRMKYAIFFYNWQLISIFSHRWYRIKCVIPSQLLSIHPNNQHTQPINLVFIQYLLWNCNRIAMILLFFRVVFFVVEFPMLFDPICGWNSQNASAFSFERHKSQYNYNKNGANMCTFNKSEIFQSSHFHEMCIFILVTLHFQLYN